jgi:flavin-dependent dehydrogenase
MLGARPPGLRDAPAHPDDERFRFVTGRRPVVEATFAAAADETAGVQVRRGVRVTGLVAGPAALPGVPHVVGVRTGDDEEIRADLVVDASGRRSPALDWLAELGAPPPYTEAEDCGFVYYPRFFTGDRAPAGKAPPLTPMGTFSLLTLPGDNSTWSVTVFGPTGDAALKAVRDPDSFSRVLGACPAHAHWLTGEPVTPVLAMAGILDRYRRFVADGRPVVTGFAVVGDAWACTNPSEGRGLSVGLIHAQLLRDTVRTHLNDPAGFALAWDAATEENVAPYYRNQIAADRARIAEMHALREGLAPPAASGQGARFAVAAMYDIDVFRAFLETRGCLALPAEVLARPGLGEKVEQLGGSEPPRVPGPDRAQLLQLLAGVTTRPAPAPTPARGGSRRPPAGRRPA